MQAQEDLLMIAVATSLLLILATTIFLFRHSLKWLLQRVIASATDHPRSSSQIDSLHASAYEISESQDVPDGWFTGAKVFSLERRAIFATTWLCITHISHFQRPGDYLTFNISDYPFFLIMGKDSILRGFHNVCRHRAYTVTRKPVGSSLVLGCRYHGWSYDTKGRLTKAPKFDDIPSFKREENNLYQIWVKTDNNGFIFVNFQGDWSVQDPDMTGLAQFANSAHISSISSMVEFWQAEGDFNWKLASLLFEASNDHPFVGYKPKASLLTRLFDVRYQQQATCQPSSISALRSIPGTNLWCMTVVEPLSATRSSLRRTLYSTTPTDKHCISRKLIDDVHNDFRADLQSLIQKQIDVTASTSSVELNTTMTPSQTRLLEQIEAHLKRERKAGTQIFPAAQSTADKDGNSSASGVAERRKISSPIPSTSHHPQPISQTIGSRTKPTLNSMPRPR
ncbi:ISP domain-containing protein [Venturia nashicola]|nr:ISP domain-containing protein [Venturia nashicola]